MGEVIHRDIQFVTTQKILQDKPYVDGVYPMREWSVQVLMEGDNGTPIAPPFIDKVIFKLHESFANPNKTVKKPPFKIIEEGWGEFEMHIAIHYTDSGGSQTFAHDLNFQSGESYTTPKQLTFRNPKPNLLRALQGGKRTTEDAPSSKKSKKQKQRSVDIDKLADGLQALQEDDLLQVVQLVNDAKTDEMYVRNDLEEGEFHIDLHTLSDQLLLDLQRFIDTR